MEEQNTKINVTLLTLNIWNLIHMSVYSYNDHELSK